MVKYLKLLRQRQLFTLLSFYGQIANFYSQGRSAQHNGEWDAVDVKGWGGKKIYKKCYIGGQKKAINIFVKQWM